MNGKSDRIEFQLLYYVPFVFLFFILLFFTKRVIYCIIFSIAAMINIGTYFILQKVLLSVVQKRRTKGFYLFSYFLRLIVIAIAFIILASDKLLAGLAFLAGMSIVPLSLTIYALRQRGS